MSDCRFGVSPVNYPDPDPDQHDAILHQIVISRPNYTRRNGSTRLHIKLDQDQQITLDPDQQVVYLKYRLSMMVYDTIPDEQDILYK